MIREPEPGTREARVPKRAFQVPKPLRRLLAVLLWVLMLKGFVSVFEPRLVFFPFKGEDANPAALGIRFEPLRLTTGDDQQIVAWQLEPDDPIADVVYFHGNGGNLSVWLPVLASLHEQRLRVLAIDYRGYGLSTGAPSEEGVYLDAAATVKHIAQQRGPAGKRPLVFWGRSLGGPIAAAASRVVTPDGLVLENSFAEKSAVVRSQPVLRLLNLFSSYRFSTVELLRDFKQPVLVLHGDRDSVIPFALGRELFERLSGPKRFVAVAGADHNDLVDPGNDAYWQPILEFVSGLRD